jgi:hypothetical protein
MRTLAAATVFGLLVISHPTVAQDRKPQTSRPDASSSQVSTSQEGDAQAAARKKAEDIEKARQRRLDKLGRSICTGC